MLNNRLSQVLDECGRELATNFDKAAIAIIAWHASRVALSTEEFQTLLERKAGV
jgi:hypothetical protein